MQAYERLRRLVLAGAQSAPGLAAVVTQGLWAWLRLVGHEQPSSITKQHAAVLSTAAAQEPSRRCGDKPQLSAKQTQQLAQLWAQMVLARPVSTATGSTATGRAA